MERDGGTENIVKNFPLSRFLKLEIESVERDYMVDEYMHVTDPEWEE